MSELPAFTVVIPARLGSSRLPGKPLADIHGRPMLAWVYQRASLSGAAEIIVATDDRRVVDACAAFGARALLTRDDHASGTDRIAEVAERCGWEDDHIVVNVQGDEPLIPPVLISQAAELAARDRDAAIATLVTPIFTEEERRNPNVVKVVLDRQGRALYFSRAPIPWPRDGGMPQSFRHVGIYAYRVSALRVLTAAGPCVLEEVEKLEQLRALWLGLGIAVAEAVEIPPPGVDTEEALREARRRLSEGD